MSQGIERKTKIGVFWSASTTAFSQVFTFIFGVILARLLSPEDFGVIAATIIFNEIASTIVSSGVTTALIQRKDVQGIHYSSALTLMIILSIVVCGILVSISPWVGIFFHNKLVGEVMAVMAIYVLILPFIAIPTAKLYSQIDFRSTGIGEIIQQLTGGIISVLLAYYGWGIWSLVYGKLIGRALKAFVLAYLIKWRISFSLKLKAIRDIFSFGAKVVMSNILNDIASNIDYLVIGRLLGPAQLGFYSRAYSLMTLPLTRITSVTQNVLFSAFSDIQNDKSALKKGLLKAVCYISLISFPLLTCLFFISPAFIHTVYGEKWMAAVLPLKIMCFAGMLLSVEPIIVSAIVAMGYIGIEVKRQLIYLIILTVGVYIGSYWGIVGVSFAVLFASIIFFLMCQLIIRRVLQISFYEFAEILMPAIFVCGVMSLVLFSYQLIFKNFFTIYSLPMLLSSTIVGFICFIICFFFFNKFWIGNQIVVEVLEELESYIYKVCRIILNGGGTIFKVMRRKIKESDSFL